MLQHLVFPLQKPLRYRRAISYDSKEYYVRLLSGNPGMYQHSVEHNTEGETTQHEPEHGEDTIARVKGTARTPGMLSPVQGTLTWPPEGCVPSPDPLLLCLSCPGLVKAPLKRSRSTADGADEDSQDQLQEQLMESGGPEEEQRTDNTSLLRLLEEGEKVRGGETFLLNIIFVQ